MSTAHPLAASMTEDELEAAIRKIILGLRGHGRDVLAYHPWKLHARRAAVGWPDWSIAGAGGVIFRELKREGMDPTPAQRMWLDFMTAAGIDAGVWRPGDLLAGTVAREIAAVAGLTVAS